MKGTFVTKPALPQLGSVKRIVDTKGALPQQLDHAAVLGFSRSLDAIAANQKRLELVGVSSPLALKANNIFFPDLSRSVRAFTSSPVIDAIGSLRSFKAEMTTLNLMVGGVSESPASSFVAQLTRHPLPWVSQKFATDNLRVTGLTTALPRLYDLETLKLGLLMPGLQPGWDAPFKAFRELGELAKRWLDEAVAEAAREWETDPLGFILSPLPENCRRLLVCLDREEVEEVILFALEQVTTGSEFLPRLREALGDAHQLDPYQRENLRHGLELAEEGKYVTAIPSLLTGLEGSINRMAEELGIIDAGRRLVGRQRGNGRLNTGHIIHEMEPEPRLGRLTHKRVFHKTGQDFRHGKSDGSERRQVLLTVVAVSGWTDHLTGHSTCADLVQLIADALPSAVERVEALSS